MFTSDQLQLTRKIKTPYIFLKQKNCIRILSKAKYNADTNPLFFSLKFLPVAELILLQKLCFMHSIEYWAPSFFINNIFRRNRQIENPLRNLDDFFIVIINSGFLVSPFIPSLQRGMSLILLWNPWLLKVNSNINLNILLKMLKMLNVWDCSVTNVQPKFH